jgi:hypothetical protein
MEEWAKLAITLLVSVSTAGWAMWNFNHQRKMERERERKRLVALYINPFLSACEELQSRLYNLLCRNGLIVLRSATPDGAHAEETLYLIVQYFGWQRCVYRHGPYSQDPRVLEIAEKIREAFANSNRPVGPFCFFRTEQRVLGQVVIEKQQGEFGPEAETIPFYEFKERMRKPPFSEMRAVRETLRGLREADDPSRLEGRERIAEVQNHLVDLLEYIEGREGFTLFVGGPRKKAQTT